LFGNWYTHIVLAAGGIQSNVVDVQGTPYFTLTGGATYDFRQDLSKMGFRWDGIVPRAWAIEVTHITANQRAKDYLEQSMGVDLMPLTATPGTQPQPQQPVAQPQPPATPAVAPTVYNEGDAIEEDFTVLVSKPSKYNHYYLLEEASGVKMAVFMDDEGFVAGDVIRISGIVKWENYNGRDQIRIIKPKVVSQPSGQDGDAQQEDEQPDDPNAVKGRIPDDRISPEQKGVEVSFLQSDDNIMMNALAGAGKTTMLKHLASFKDPAEKWIYIVFGKKNQTEASSGKGKFPNGVEVKTSHSFLGNILGKSAKMDLIDSSSLIPKGYGGSRMFRMVDAYMKNDSTFPRHLNWPAKISISRLANLAKNFAVIPSDPGATDLLKGLIQSFTIDVTLEDNKNGVPSPNARDWTPQIIDKAMDMLHYSTPDNPLPEPDPNRNLFRGLRDQDDTLWYSAIYADQISWPRYDVVLADEVQDFNRCQVLMLQKLEEQGARIVAVGDPNQAVYRFRGGENETFDTITQNTGGAQHELPTNYRSGKNIIDYVNQNTNVHDLQAGLQHDGEVTEGMSYDNAIMGLQDEWTDGGGKLKEETAFISRVNAPLTSAAMDLLKRGMNFVVLGKNFSEELTKHISSVAGKDQNKNERVMGIDQFMSELIRYSEDKQKKWKGRIAKSEALSKVTEATEALTSVVSHLREMNFFDQELNIRVNTTRDLRTYLVERFRGVDEDSAKKVQDMKKKDPRTFVLLTTAHKAKGMQFKRVFIVEDQLFPHPNAKNSEDLVQEGNLKYVAYTRAENELHVLEPKPDDQ